MFLPHWANWYWANMIGRAGIGKLALGKRPYRPYADNSYFIIRSKTIKEILSNKQN